MASGGIVVGFRMDEFDKAVIIVITFFVATLIHHSVPDVQAS
jgi:hypothetical protein